MLDKSLDGWYNNFCVKALFFMFKKRDKIMIASFWRCKTNESKNHTCMF